MARLAVGLAVLLVLTGCTAPGGSARRFQSRPMPGATLDTAMVAARTVLKREYGGVKADSGPYSIVSRAISYETQKGTGTARDLYGGRSAVRERAHCQVVSRAGTPVVMLRIELQRRDTTATRALGPERRYRLGDQPSFTPIEEDAATTDEQNEVWTLLRRDTQRERELLVELQGFFADNEPAETTTPVADTTVSDS